MASIIMIIIVCRYHYHYYYYLHYLVKSFVWQACCLILRAKCTINCGHQNQKIPKHSIESKYESS